MTTYTITVNLDLHATTQTDAAARVIADTIRDQTALVRARSGFRQVVVSFEADNNYTARSYALVAMSALEKTGVGVKTATIHEGLNPMFSTRYDLLED